WVQLWGDELSLSSPEANALPPRGDGPAQHFRLVESSEGRFLEWNGERAPLLLPDSSPMLEVLGHRLTRRLSEGLPLRELAWTPLVVRPRRPFARSESRSGDRRPFRAQPRPAARLAPLGRGVRLAAPVHARLDLAASSVGAPLLSRRLWARHGALRLPRPCPD